MMTNDKAIVGKDQFLAKKSGSYTTDISSDKDVWREYLAVVEMVVPGNAGAKNKETYELQIKSFFESAHTGKRSWDEPPSGATTISYASEEDRKVAEEERATLQTTTRSYGSNDAQKEPSRSFSRLNVFRRWRRRKNKGGTLVGGILPRIDSNGGVIKENNFSASASGSGSGSGSGGNACGTDKEMANASETTANTQGKSVVPQINLDEQNAIAMAQALSLSERDIIHEREREATIQTVLYESGTGAYSGGTGLAYGSRPLESLEEGEDERNQSHYKEVPDELNTLNGKSDNDGDLKMPAT